MALTARMTRIAVAFPWKIGMPLSKPIGVTQLHGPISVIDWLSPMSSIQSKNTLCMLQMWANYVQRTLGMTVEPIVK
jgi:hypothetical protein